MSEFDKSLPHKTVDGVLEYLTPEEIAELAAKKAAYESSTSLILDQIRELEAQMTNRRLREYLRGDDGGWWESMDQQILALRSELNAS